MKKSREEQRHLAQSRRGAESEKKTKALSVLNLCVSASLREFIDSFTPSEARATKSSRAAKKPGNSATARPSRNQNVARPSWPCPVTGWKPVPQNLRVPRRSLEIVLQRERRRAMAHRTRKRSLRPRKQRSSSLWSPCLPGESFLRGNQLIILPNFLQRTTDHGPRTGFQ